LVIYIGKGFAQN